MSELRRLKQLEAENSRLKKMVADLSLDKGILQDVIQKKKTHRIYCEERLNLRRRPCRRVAAAHRMERPEFITINECWSMDFVADSLFNGHRIRALNVVDNISRECLAITVHRALRGEGVVSTLDHIASMRGTPMRIQVDNGSEFISRR